MWKGLYFVFYVLLQHVHSVKICSGETSGPDRRVDVELYNVSGPCTCDIQVTRSKNQPSVTLNFTHFQLNDDKLCSKFKLVFKNNDTDKSWCGSESNFLITLDTSKTLYKSDTLKMTLVDNGTTNSFKFEIFTQTSENLVRIECYPPPTPTLKYTTTTELIPLVSPTSSLSLLSSTTFFSHFNTYQSTTNSVANRTEITTVNTIKEDERPDDVSYLPIILGCSVGGTVIIILVITIIGCVLLRRQKTYTGGKIENPKHGDLIITENEVYLSSDSIPNNTSQYGTKTITEMEIIPNDFYQSSDSLADESKDSEPHELVPNTSTEYAVVKNKPKKVSNKDKGIELKINPNITQTEKDKLNLKIEIDRIVGPKGDDYTLVNKF